VKATDVASHDGKIQQKVKMITKIDRMVNHIIKKVDLDETIIAITSDHTTSIATREHEGDPVSIAIQGSNVRIDDVLASGVVKAKEPYKVLFGMAEYAHA
jgi:2,3-bisphosphoglycerate-independent phosphoglycerate mutase